MHIKSFVQPFSDHRTLKVGLMGGSFNPIHAGHIQVAKEAHKHLGLHEVWMVVARHNPHKKNKEMAAFEMRYNATVKAAAPYPFIKVKRVEQDFNLTYSVDTIYFLSKRCPKVDFTWVMGVDSLIHLHHWQHWRRFVRSTPLAVFDRPGYTVKGLTSPAGQYVRQQFSRFHQTSTKTLPALRFISMPHCALSSTELRQLAAQQKGAS